MANNSSQTNDDVVEDDDDYVEDVEDLGDYNDAGVVAFGTVIHKLSTFKGAIEEISQSQDFLNICLNNEFIYSLDRLTGWVKPGIDCEILKGGSKNWKKGKIKIELTVKFYPDEH